MTVSLSVVVPFHNVERYIGSCLRSLQGQTLSDLEVILVDDGSLDGSLAIAEEFAAADPRFSIVRQHNQGLGPARNTGTRAARGRYLTFVDSDDLVPRHAYEQLVGSLEGSGSDFAAGDARRFNDLGVRDSYVHAIPFERQRIGTHVLQFPELVLDRMAWNKVYRRSFYDAQGLEFPPMLYEDFPVSVKAHVRATAVDVLSAPVYYWRERDGGDESITQRRWELSNIRDRVTSAEDVLRFLHAEAPSLLPVVEAHLVHIDVAAVAAALHQNDPAEHEEIFDLANRLRSRMSPESRSRAIPFDRVQDFLLSVRDLDRLRGLIDYRAVHGVTAPMRRVRRRPLPRRRGFYFELPYLEDRTEPRVPVERYRVPNHHIQVVSELLDASWEGDSIELRLSVGLDFLPMTEQSEIRLWLEDDSGVEHPVPVLERTRGYRKHFEDDLCRVHVRVDPRALTGADGDLAESWWRLHAEVRTGGLRVGGPVVATARGRARMFPLRALDGGLWTQLQPRVEGIGVRLRRGRNAVDRIELDGTDFVLGGWLEGPLPEQPPVLRLVLEEGLAQDLPLALTGPVPESPRERPTGVERHGFTVRVDGTRLISDTEHDDLIEELAVWAPSLRMAGGERLVTLAPDVADVELTKGARRLVASRTLVNNLSFHETYAGPESRHIRWSGEATIALSGSLGVHHATEGRLVARRYVTAGVLREVELPRHPDGAGFTTEIDVAALVSAAEDAVEALETKGVFTPWVLWLETEAGRIPVTASRDSIGHSVAPRRILGHDVFVEFGRGERVEVRVT